MNRAGLFFAAAAIVLGACGGGSKTVDRPAVELGDELFHSSSLSLSSYNRFSCATCHATAAPDDVDRVHAGATLFDAAHRPDWFDGYSRQYLDAVNFCLVFFMRGEALAPGNPDGDALWEYLDSISPDASAPRVPYTFVNAITALPPGSAGAGQAVYDRTCRVCHGDKDSGAGRISSSTTKLDAQLSADYDTLFPGQDHNVVVIEKVRHGQFYGIGGNMPFFSEEKLSDADLSDLLAYLAL